MFYGLGFDPADSAPAVIAVIVGVFVWQRHRADRRARVFLALAVAEFSFGIPLGLAAAAMPGGRAGVAVLQGLVVAAGLVSTVLFLHFGCAFPHARPWVRQGRFRALYWASIGLALAYGAVTFVLTRDRSNVLLNVAMFSLGLAVFAASVAACVSIYRSYREMTADGRARYRVPIIGVLAGMVSGLVADLLVTALFEMSQSLDIRYFMWTLNLVSTFSELLLPLFFFMATVKYRLLEHHSQDYVAKL